MLSLFERHNLVFFHGRVSDYCYEFLDLALKRLLNDVVSSMLEFCPVICKKTTKLFLLSLEFGLNIFLGSGSLYSLSGETLVFLNVDLGLNGNNCLKFKC